MRDDSVKPTDPPGREAPTGVGAQMRPRMSPRTAKEFRHGVAATLCGMAAKVVGQYIWRYILEERWININCSKSRRRFSVCFCSWESVGKYERARPLGAFGPSTAFFHSSSPSRLPLYFQKSWLSCSFTSSATARSALQLRYRAVTSSC